MKKFISLLCLLILTFTISGCKNQKPEEIIYGDIKEDMEDIENTNTLTENNEKQEKTSENKEEQGTKFIDTLDNNVDNNIPLNNISINGKIYSLPMSKTIIEEIKECPFANAYHNTDEYFFQGKGWGLQSDPNDPMSFDGSTIFFSIDESEEIITGSNISSFWIDDDLNVIFADFIKIGTPKEDIETKLGLGIRSDDKIFYKNSTGILALEYENDLVEDMTIIIK